MGHDLTAFRAGTKIKVAHLRKSAAEATRSRIYEVLKATQYKTIDSGTGDKRHYSCTDLSKINTSRLYKDEVVFIQTCITECGKDGVDIEFA